MRISRKSFAVAIASAGALALTSCAAATPTDDGAPVSITFANWEFTNGEAGERLWEQVADYTGPDGNVTLVKEATAFTSFSDKLNTELGAGGGPDVFLVQDAQFNSLARAGLLEPLDDVYERVADGLNASNDDAVIDGVRYGLNWERPNYAMLYNAALLEQAQVEVPTTFQELLQAAEAIQSATGAQGFAGRTSTTELDGWALEMGNWVFGHGGALAVDGEVTLNSAENVAALESFAELYRSGAMTVGDDSSTFRTKFGQGQIGFMFDNAGAIVSMASNADPSISSQFHAAPLPFETPTVVANPTWIVVNPHGKHIEAAKDFVEWVVNPTAQQRISSVQGAIRFATDVELTDEFIAANPWGLELLALSDDSRTTVVPGFEEDTKALWREFLTAAEAVLVGGADVQDALDQAQTIVEQDLG